MKRFEAIETIVNALKGTELIVSANGIITRELCTINDKPTNFYMLGSMGLASSIGLGLALSFPNKKIVVLDGDGNILMNLGSLTTIGNLAPKNLIHIVLDNECYESTGGQPTVSATAKLEKTAEAAGYKAAKRVEYKETLKETVAQLLDATGPSFVLVKTMKGREDVPRVPYEPETITCRFKAAVK